MGKRGTRLAAVVMAMGIVGSMAPAASASETLVPCETIFGEYLCQQMNDTGQFVDDTVGRLGPIVDEWRDRIAAAGKTVTDTVWCIVGGGCIAIEP
jgi:hypothetical protein